MARGAEAKQDIFRKLQEVFPDSFFEEEGKILRIPMSEAGVRVEIKCQLTAAKNNLGGENVPGAFGEMAKATDFTNTNMPAPAQNNESSLEMTQEEKNNVAKLMRELGL